MTTKTELRRVLLRTQFRAEKLRQALHLLYTDNMDYIRVNHLVGAENNHPLKMARKALALK